MRKVTVGESRVLSHQLLLKVRCGTSTPQQSTHLTIFSLQIPKNSSIYMLESIFNIMRNWCTWFLQQTTQKRRESRQVKAIYLINYPLLSIKTKNNYCHSCRGEWNICILTTVEKFNIKKSQTNKNVPIHNTVYKRTPKKRAGHLNKLDISFPFKDSYSLKLPVIPQLWIWLNILVPQYDIQVLVTLVRLGFF